MNINFSKIKKIHFVGIKGIAMAALAVYCKERGFVVSGTDTEEEFPSDEVLKKAGIEPLVGFDIAHVQKTYPDLVIYTGAHNGRDNIEVAEALKKNIPVLSHGKALGMFMEGKRQISVAGSHGKTTTAAIIATILTHSGYDPAYAIGCGEIAGLGEPGHYGRGDWFIAEADEYVTDPGHDATPRFLWQSPEILVITNIDFDHPDVYSSLSDVEKAFKKIREKVGGSGEVITASDARISNLHYHNGRTYFQLETSGVVLPEIMLQVPGRHNAINASLAALAANRAGISWDLIIKALSQFGGAKRRFEKIATVGTTVFYDDYAHHPAEIRATLSAARARFPKQKIIAVFQPHTYSRTKALLDEFARSFSDADFAITTDIYASAREHDTLGISGETLAEKVAQNHRNSFFAKGKEEVKKILDAKVSDGDIIIFMGAGDIYKWGKEIVKEFKSS